MGKARNFFVRHKFESWLLIMMGVSVFLSGYRWGNHGTRRVQNLLPFLPVESAGNGVATQAVWFKDNASHCLAITFPCMRHWILPNTNHYKNKNKTHNSSTDLRLSHYTMTLLFLWFSSSLTLKPWNLGIIGKQSKPGARQLFLLLLFKSRHEITRDK